MLATRPFTSDKRSGSRPRLVHSSRKAPKESDGDQSSWIADDICTHCGGLASHGKLYCSSKCRDADASAAKLRIDTMAEHETGQASELADSLLKLRYPMSLSPTLQHHSLPLQTTQSLVTKPAFTHMRKSSDSSASSENESGPVDRIRSRFHARHGSRSSESTGSDAMEPMATPSPWRSGVDLGYEDEFASLDDAALELPHAMYPSSQILLRRDVSVKTGATPTSSYAGKRASSQASPLVTPQTPGSATNGFHIQFSRHPGSTNRPTPVLYSASTVGKGGHDVVKTHRASPRQGSAHEPVHEPMPGKPAAGDKYAGAERARSVPSPKSSFLRTTTTPTKPGAENYTNNSPLTSRRTYSDGTELCVCELASIQSTPPTSTGMEARGRARCRTKHSCATGHRRSSRASYDAGSLCLPPLDKMSRENATVPEVRVAPLRPETRKTPPGQ